MPTIKASKRVNRQQLHDEIVAAVPSLASTPTGPDGKLEAQFVIEEVDGETLVHLLKDDVDPTDESNVGVAVKDHKRKPEKTFDKVAEARQRVKQKADQGDPLAQDIMTLLG